MPSPLSIVSGNDEGLRPQEPSLANGELGLMHTGPAQRDLRNTDTNLPNNPHTPDRHEVSRALDAQAQGAHTIIVSIGKLNLDDQSSITRLGSRHGL